MTSREYAPEEFIQLLNNIKMRNGTFNLVFAVFAISFKYQDKIFYLSQLVQNSRL